MVLGEELEEELEDIEARVPTERKRCPKFFRSVWKD